MNADQFYVLEQVGPIGDRPAFLPKLRLAQLCSCLRFASGGYMFARLQLMQL